MEQNNDKSHLRNGYCDCMQYCCYRVKDGVDYCICTDCNKTCNLPHDFT